MSLRSAGDDVVSRIARLLELEGDRWRPHRALELLSFVLGDRAQVGDASRYIFAYARHRGYDLPPYPLAGCGEIREFFADEGVRNVPDWYEKKLGLDERAYEALPSQTIVVVRDRADRRKAFFLDGMRYRNAAAYENLADSGFARTLSEDDLEALLSRMLAFLTGDDAFSEAETTSVGPLRGSSCAFYRTGSASAIASSSRRISALFLSAKRARVGPPPILTVHASSGAASNTSSSVRSSPAASKKP